MKLADKINIMRRKKLTKTYLPGLQFLGIRACFPLLFNCIHVSKKIVYFSRSECSNLQQFDCQIYHFDIYLNLCEVAVATLNLDDLSFSKRGKTLCNLLDLQGPQKPNSKRVKEMIKMQTSQPEKLEKTKLKLKLKTEKQN